MKDKIIAAIFMGLLSVPVNAYSQAISDYLILQDIGVYQIDKPRKHLPGEPPWGGPKVGKNAGVVGGSHFPDHIDMSYVVMYLGPDSYVSPIVTITQHSGGDSDKWLLHEVEISYRSSKTERLGMLLQGAFTRNIGTYKVFSHGIGGGGYTWLSNNNVVVDISYTSLVAGKPKPTEIVQAYLAKFPSVIPATLALNSAHDVIWIKDEIERRLWLCDKWLLRIQPGDAELYDRLDSLVSNMTVFLDYREKYFGVSAKNEKKLLLNYLSKKDDASIKSKLQEYKVWWSAHKGDSITLP